MTAALLRAEWLKLRKLRLTWLMPILPSALVLLGAIPPIFALADTYRRFGTAASNDILSAYAFPQPMLAGLQIANLLGSLLVVIFVTATVGNEFGFDTWKVLLTRRAERGRFLLVKLGYALAEATAILIIVPIVFQLGILLALRATLDIAPPGQVSPGELESLGVTFIISWIRLAIAATIGLLATIVTRSSGGGMAIAAPWLLADFIVYGLGFTGGMWRDIVPYTFNLNLVALEAYLGGRAGAVSLAHCLIVLSLYTIGFTLLAVTIFRRRDVAG